MKNDSTFGKISELNPTIQGVGGMGGIMAPPINF